MKRFVLALSFVFIAACSSEAHDLDTSSPQSFVASLIEAPKSELDFGQAKLAVDKFADSAVDDAALGTQLDGLVATIRKMLATLPAEVTATDVEKLNALRAFVYEAGWWNDNRPFQYDLSDPLGQTPGAQALPTYLATRKGNCVSMPMLFVALGERLGLEMTLSTAPLHVFVKWTEQATGKTWNLEATSGAGFTRVEHYRKIMPMTDEAIRNGVYLKTLSRKEALSVIATGVVDHLLRIGRYEEAIAVADVLIAAYPANVYALTKKGTAYYRLLKRDIIDKYPTEADIPTDKLAYATGLYRANQEAFARAEALGWREPEMNQ